MKLYIFLFAILIIVVQTIFTQSLSDKNNLKRMSSAWGKRMSSAWGKRMSSAWGKRADNENDDYNRFLREYYHQARLNKYDYPRYPIDTDVFEYLAQHGNNEEDTAPQNLS